jgi:hypothetical protein
MLLEPSSRMLIPNTLSVMPDDRVAGPAARRSTLLKIVGWVSYFITVALFVLFVVLWIRGDVPKQQELYPLPGIASAFLIIGVWTVLGPALYRSRSTATRAGKYVIAVILTILFYPIVVTGVSSLAAWIVSLVPGSPLH